jgi:hypothetical protein
MLMKTSVKVRKTSVRVRKICQVNKNLSQVNKNLSQGKKTSVRLIKTSVRVRKTSVRLIKTSVRLIKTFPDKQQSSLCFTKNQTTKVYGETEIQLHAFLSWAGDQQSLASCTTPLCH